MDEPRIHFAINCASRSCPKLQNVAYYSHKLENQLENAASEFINDLTKNKIMVKRLMLSKIFSWFKDDFGNKYYENKNGNRWVIYSNEIDASKIPVEWYSWMHFTPNRIEKKHDLKKYDWQKPHQSNLTGTKEAYYPNKNNDNVIEKKYKTWKI